MDLLESHLRRTGAALSRRALLLGCAGLSAALLCAQDPAGPPVIRPYGVVNAASRMPPGMASGAIARGSIFTIQGSRLAAPGSAVSAVRIQISGETQTVEALPLSVSPLRINAFLPDSAPLGRVVLTVTDRGQTSLPYRLTVTASSFGIFTRNGRGWGPGMMQGSGQPGGIATLEGTGVGRAAAAQVTVLVGGQSAPAISVRKGAQRGRDEIQFRVPTSAPQGCSVPVVVVTRLAQTELISNQASMAIAPAGQPCRRSSNWVASAMASQGKSAGLILIRSSLQVPFASGTLRTFISDELSGFFRERGPHEATAAGQLPPPGTCATFAFTTKLGAILSAIGLGGRTLGGQALDAGPSLLIKGDGTGQTAGKDPRDRQSYRAHLGGEALGTRQPARPLFLNPGDYTVAGLGGAAVGPFETAIHFPEMLRWTNQAEIAAVDRSRALTFRWAAAPDDSQVALIALNLDQLTGAAGVTVCLAPNRATEFSIPARELSNFPVSYQMSGVPSNYIGILAFPDKAVSFAARGLNGGWAGWILASLKAVPFR